MINKDLIEQLNKKEMILTQINSWELILKNKGLADSTIERKINNIISFYIHLNTCRLNNEKVKTDNISQIAYEYVREGFFNTENIDNEGSYGYRRNIYTNIREGFNWIYEDYFKDNKNELILDLDKDQKEVLEDISKNKFFKTFELKDDKHTIQTKLIEDLGIKVYFDENNKPYVFSHELTETINIENKHINQKIKKMTQETVSQNFDRPLKSSNFNVLQVISMY